jgi:hypothetical protein
MRRFFAITTLFATLVLAAAAAGARQSPGDGTLALKNASGVFVIQGKGAAIGQLDRGSVRILDPNPNDGPPAIVSGWEHTRDLTDKSSMWSGTDVNFRMIGGTFKIQISGKGIDLSFVGRGQVTLTGLGSSDDGRYSLDGGDTYKPIPLLPASLPIPPLVAVVPGQ